MSYDPEQEPYVALRTKALESLLIEKGLISAEAVDEQVSRYEQDIGPLRGAQVVARAWTRARCATVVGRQVLAIALQCDGVVGRHFSAETRGAFGEARVVFDDGALEPVDTTISRGRYTVFAVSELAITFQLFVGVPVTRGASNRAAFDKAGCIGLSTFGVDRNRGEFLALGFCVSRGGYAADGQGQ